jgi:serine protease
MNLLMSLKNIQILLFLSILTLTGCNNSGDDSSASSSNSGSFTISGRISVASNTATDGDLNDVNTLEQSNNNTFTAQSIPNPVILGGYVNESGRGPDGRFDIIGDKDDFFKVELHTGQIIALFVANQNLGDNDLDLGLLKLNDDGTAGIVDASVGAGDAEILIVPSDGEYFVQVRAYLGYSNYVLTIGQEISVTSHSMRLTDPFVPGDVIVKLASDSLHTQSATDTLCMHTESTDPSRRMLYQLKPNQCQPSRTLAAKNNPLKFATPELRLKHETLMAVKQLRRQSGIAEASPNYILQEQRVPNDTNYRYQWNHPLIKLPQAWDTTVGDPSVIVAVIDSGVLLDHPDLQGNLIQGYDFIKDITISLDGDGIDSDPTDPGSELNRDSPFHGTHVAGTVAASTDNNKGVAGVAWLTKIMPLRVTGKGGSGYDYDIAQGIRYAAGLPNDSRTLPAQRADIINLSLGGPQISRGFQQLMNKVRAAGVIVVAAAGNEDSDIPSYPAALDGVVSVSAISINKRRASYSNFGPSIDVAAPGGDNTPDLNGDGIPDGIISTVGDEVGYGSGKQKIEFTYRPLEGTSMAAPHVTGVISLMKAVNPNLTPQNFDDLLNSGKITDDLGPKGQDDNFGQGLINAQKAVLAAIEVGGGFVPESSPTQLLVNPRALNFGLNRTSATITLSNGGGGFLEIKNVREDSGGFLSYEGSGLGDYTIMVDRSRLTTGTFTTAITITSNINTVKVPVILQKGDSNVTGDAGVHYVLLIDPDTLDTLQDTSVTVNDGVYNFRFNNIPRGTYIITAGSDFNNDGFICDAGEACGAFTTLDSPTSINISTSRSSVNFNTGFNINFLSAKTITANGNTYINKGYARIPIRKTKTVARVTVP